MAVVDVWAELRSLLMDKGWEPEDITPAAVAAAVPGRKRSDVVEDLGQGWRIERRMKCLCCGGELNPNGVCMVCSWPQ